MGIILNLAADVMRWWFNVFALLVLVIIFCGIVQRSRQANVVGVSNNNDTWHAHVSRQRQVSVNQSSNQSRADVEHARARVLRAPPGESVRHAHARAPPARRQPLRLHAAHRALVVSHSVSTLLTERSSSATPSPRCSPSARRQPLRLHAAHRALVGARPTRHAVMMAEMANICCDE